jgi:DNA polymerase-3 subunit alpha
MAAVMNNANSIEKITFFMEECQRMGIKVLGPDINESLKGFSVNKDGVVRFGLGAIKGVGEAAVEDLIAEREENGVFKSIFDMITRVNQRTVNKKSLESLVHAGGFDCFTEHHRAQYFHAPAMDPVTGIERIIRFGSQFQAAESLTVNSLFGDADMPDIKPPELPPCEKWTLHDLLEKEKEAIGIYLSGHPLDGFKFEMQHYNIVPINELDNYRGRQVRIAGFVSNPYHGISKKGDKYGRMVINDYSGNLELNFWKENYVQYGNYLEESQKLMITGTYDESRFRPGQLEFRISGVMLLGDVKSKFTKRLSMALPLQKLDRDFVDFLQTNFAQNPGGCDLNIIITDEATEFKTALRSSAGKVLVNDDLIEYLQTADIAYKVEIS